MSIVLFPEEKYLSVFSSRYGFKLQRYVILVMKSSV